MHHKAFKNLAYIVDTYGPRLWVYFIIIKAIYL